MKLFALVLFVGACQAALVRREAEPKAEAGHYGGPAGYAAPVGGHVSEPVCTSVPQKTCNPRQVRQYDHDHTMAVMIHC